MMRSVFEGTDPLHRVPDGCPSPSGGAIAVQDLRRQPGASAASTWVGRPMWGGGPADTDGPTPERRLRAPGGHGVRVRCRRRAANGADAAGGLSVWRVQCED